MSKKNILYCLKSGHKDGLGHLARGKYIKTFFSKKKYNFIFLSNDLKSLDKFNLSDSEIINQNLILNKSLVSIVESKKIDLIFLDFIEKIDSNILKEISKRTKVVMIQNISPGMNYCDYNIFPCIHLSAKDIKLIKKYNKKNNSNLLYGKKYLIFRPLKKKRIKKNLISIYTGGSDPYDISEKILKIISTSTISKKYSFKFFYGSLFSENKIKKLKRFRIPIKKFNIKEISSSNLVISTFGIITYELLSIQIKQLIITYNTENNCRGNLISKKSNIIKNLGIYKNFDSKGLIRKVIKFIAFNNKVINTDIKDMTASIIKKINLV